MPDLQSRGAWEERLRAAVAGLQPDELRRVMEHIHATGDVELPSALWEKFERELGDAIRPVLVSLYLEGARVAAAQYPTLAVNWTLINQRAANWASQYTFDLVSQITDTTRSGLQQAIKTFFESQDIDMAELRRRIGEFIPTIQDKLGRTLFSSTRAQMIATTEVTRASVAGELEWRAEIRAANHGIKMRAIFNTNNDELVCPVCAPHNQQSVSVRNYPPLHPRCRCWLNHEITNLGQMQ
jgi:hypothetical protein